MICNATAEHSIHEDLHIKRWRLSTASAVHIKLVLTSALSRFDLVVASYVLGEARSPSERRRLVDALWRRTGGMLVLVEPGTPVGSANVREARAQVGSRSALAYWCRSG